MPSTPIHRLLGYDTSDVTIELLQAAVVAGLEERIDLEWKSGLSQEKGREELAKDLAAMANGGGGWLVYGIREGRTPHKEEDGRATKLVGVSQPESVKRTIRSTALNLVYPPLLRVQIVVVGTDQTAAVVVHVPASPDTPHLARFKDVGFRAPVRDGSHTRDMSEAELEQAYQQRARERERVLHTLGELYGEVTESAPARLKMRFVGVAVPRVPRPLTAGRVDASEVHSVIRSAQGLASTFAMPVEPAATELHWSVPEPAQTLRRGLRRWISRPSGGRFAEASVHFDGAVTLTADIDRAERSYPVSSGVVPSQVLEARIGGLLALAAAAQRELDVSSDYDVQVGIAWEDRRQALTIEAPGGHKPDALSRFAPVRTTLPAAAPSLTVHAVAYDLALDVLNQGGHHQGTVIAPAPDDAGVTGS